MYHNFLDRTLAKRKISKSQQNVVNFIKNRINYLCVFVLLCMLALTSFSSIVVAQDSPGMPAPENHSELQAFQDWSLRCVNAVPTVSAKQPSPIQAACEAGQTVTVDQNGQKVEILKLAISPARDKAGKSDWALVALFPLDLLLNSDFGLSTGKEKPTLYRFRNCNHLGCFGVVPLDKATLARFEKSDEGAVYFRLLNGKAVKVLFSLKGFAPAFQALQSQAKSEGGHGTTGPGSKK